MPMPRQSRGAMRGTMRGARGQTGKKLPIGRGRCLELEDSDE